MSSPRASAEGLALGDQRTLLSAEVDPTEQCRSTELEQYSMRDARSDKSTQTTIAAQVLPPMPGLAEKGHGNPDHHPPPGPHTSRHNSMDSNASSVGGGSYYSAPSPGNKIKRSSTGWTSVATASSVATSIIEEEEEEPDVLSLKEQAEEPFGLDGHFGLDERYASSDSPQATPSQGGNDFEFKRFFGRSLTYQSPTPSRSSSINEDFDFAASSTTHKVHPFSSSPRPNSPAQRIATMPKYKRDKAPMGLRLDSAMRRDSLPLRSRVEHPSPSRLRRQATDQLCGPSAVGVGAPRPHSKLAQDWEPASPTNPATPVSEEPEGEEDDTEMGESELPTPVADHDEDMAGDSADGSSGCGSHPGTPPSLEGNTPVGSPKSDSSSLRHMHHDQMHHDQDMVGAICDLILERTHGVRLRDLTTSDDAWQAVNYCLEELGRIVDVNAALPGQTSIPIRETPAGYNHGDPSGYRQWNGCAGGSGSQGRHNDGQDGQLPQGGYGGGYGPDGSGGAGQGGNGTGKPSGKRNRDSDTLTTQYSCPYRKRNPARFNVRLHLPCATQSFPDISQVKRHVKTFHRRNTGLFLCIRCKRSFETESLHRRHLQQDPDKMCKVRDQAQEETNGDPELGVSSSIIDELNERKQNSKVDTWDGLWKKLFPMDEESREPTFIQPVELDEVKEDFAMMTRDLSVELRTHVGTLQPGSNATMVGDSVAQLCVQRIEETLRTSESRARGPLPSPKRRRHHHFGKRNSAGSTQLQAEHSSSSNMGGSPVDDGEPPELGELGELVGAQFGQPQGPAHVMPSFPQPGFPHMASAHQPVGITMATTVPLAPHMVMGPQNGSDNSKSVSPANSHEAYGMTTAMMPEGGLPAGYVEAPYHWPHPGPFSDGAGFDGSFSDNTDFNNTWDKDGAF